MDLVERVKKLAAPITLVVTTALAPIKAQYSAINAVVAGGHNNGSAFMPITYPALEMAQLSNLNNANTKLTCFKGTWTSFPMSDQTGAGWTPDNDWAGRDMFTYPTTLTFQATDNAITTNMVLDNIIASSTPNDLLLVYMMGHGEGSYTPGYGDINVSTQAGATSWQGIPLANPDINYAHLNKALETANYRLAVVILDGCNSEAIIKDLDYTANLQSNPLQKNVIAIAAAAADESYSGLAFGHYFVHLTREGKTIKAAADSSGALKSLNSKIYCFGPNKTGLETFTQTRSLFDYIPDELAGVNSVRQPLTIRQTLKEQRYSGPFNLKGQMLKRTNFPTGYYINRNNLR